MASQNMDNYSKVVSTDKSVADSMITRGQNGGMVQVIYDTYETASLANGDTLNVGVLPKGATFIGGDVVVDALGASTTLALGDSGDADRYMAAVSTSSAGVKAARAIAGIGYQATADTILYATLAGANATDARTISVVLMYTLD